MKNRWFAKIAAILCAICLATGVMSQTMFARDSATALAAEEDALPEATFVVLGDETDPTAAPTATTDNRLSVPVYVDGAQRGQCAILDGEPYMEVRDLFAAIGQDIQLIDLGSSISMAMDGLLMTAQEGQRWFMCNDRYLYVPHGVKTLNGTVALPMEELVKCVGLTASWDKLQWRIDLSAGPVKPLEQGSTYYNETDLYWLSRLIYAMAAGESFETQVAVGSVCVNRMHDDAFAGENGNIYEVVFAKNQFDMVTNGMIYVEPDDAAVLAAKLALEGWDPSDGATYVSARDMGAGYECVAKLGKLKFFAKA